METRETGAGNNVGNKRGARIERAFGTDEFMLRMYKQKKATLTDMGPDQLTTPKTKRRSIMGERQRAFAANKSSTASLWGASKKEQNQRDAKREMDAAHVCRSSNTFLGETYKKKGCQHRDEKQRTFAANVSSDASRWSDHSTVST